ncbi:SidA/IucD/PvdA family monooxygenase, partial [Frankia sp. CpI1-P]
MSRIPPEPRDEPPRTPVTVPASGLPHPEAPDYDVVGVGLGPFNLSLAALADGLPGLRAAFFEQAPAFTW